MSGSDLQTDGSVYPLDYNDGGGGAGREREGKMEDKSIKQRCVLYSTLASEV